MIAIFRKEIKHFFGSLNGYLVILTFLMITGLFLWVFPGIYNISGNGYATLESFFSIAPWLYLFLVPAVTMRLFSEEKRTGTMEALLTRPISDFSLVSGKFLAGLFLVVFSLLPTLVYFFSVFQLGNPAGNIDTGSTWGSYFGLFFLATIYVAIGLFASSLTDNQIVSFIAAMVLSFVFCVGFEFIGESGIPYPLEKGLTWLSINEHYISVSRGVIDLRDIIYFTGMTGLFLFLTMLSVRNIRFGLVRFRKSLLIIPILAAILFMVTENMHARVDLTSERRFSLSEISKDLVKTLENPADAELFLAGELPPGLRKLQQAINEKIADLNGFASKPIRLKITDPYKITSTEKRNAFFEQLADKGIRPIDFRQTSDAGVSTRLIFPGAIISCGEKNIAINFLKNNPSFTGEVNLNHSIENIEFEIVDAFRKLLSEKKPVIAFLTGHDELNSWELHDISLSLSGEYEVIQVTIDELAINDMKINCLIIPGPSLAFEESEKLIIDQFIMKGGNTMWLVDPVQVSLDSLSKGQTTLAFPRNLNLDDQLFRYGVRLNYNLLQDVVCAKILVNTAPPGNNPRFSPQSWFYSPLLTPSDRHPISRNLNVVLTEFVSSVDTVSGGGDVKKSVILSTSPYSRIVRTPASISLENINNPPARELFNQPFIPVGVLLEGIFVSNFRNRMVESFSDFNGVLLAESKPARMIVIADGSIIANKVRYSGSTPTFLPLGYDRVSQQTFGNKEFLVNSIQYLNDNQGIMQLRNRTLKMRLLDKVRIREEKFFWQWFNVITPAFLIILFGIVYHFLRRNKFGRIQV